MYVVYVQDINGKPLMPTKKFGMVRHMLDSGDAKVISTKPFTIRLQYKSTSYVQPLYAGIDPGRTNIGVAVLNNKGENVYSAVLETRNKEIPKLMSDRAMHRRTSRRGERLRRKRRAIKCNTTTEFPDGRKLPGYRDGVLGLKDIINSESRFNNRKRPTNWLTPTARQLIQTHVSMVKEVQRILPVENWTLEYNKFAFMSLEDGTVKGLDFQNGRMKGYSSTEEFVCSRQHNRCFLCSKKGIKHCHHIIPRHLGGSNLPENLIGLCKECHIRLHQNKLTKEEKKKLKDLGMKKKYGGTSILNIAMPFIYGALLKLEINLSLCTGYETNELREKHFLDKEHWLDAICIAYLGSPLKKARKKTFGNAFTIKQFRNHNRANIHRQTERTYKLDGKTIAKNRKPRCEQPKGIQAFNEWCEDKIDELGLTEAWKEIGRVRVLPSTRSYNNPNRVLPGAVFICNKERYVLSGNSSGGRYYRAFGQGTMNFKVEDVKVVSQRPLAYM